MLPKRRATEDHLLPLPNFSQQWPNAPLQPGAREARLVRVRRSFAKHPSATFRSRSKTSPPELRCPQLYAPTSPRHPAIVGIPSHPCEHPLVPLPQSRHRTLTAPLARQFWEAPPHAEEATTRPVTRSTANPFRPANALPPLRWKLIEALRAT